MNSSQLSSRRWLETGRLKGDRMQTGINYSTRIHRVPRFSRLHLQSYPVDDYAHKEGLMQPTGHRTGQGWTDTAGSDTTKRII